MTWLKIDAPYLEESTEHRLVLGACPTGLLPESFMMQMPLPGCSQRLGSSHAVYNSLHCFVQSCMVKAGASLFSTGPRCSLGDSSQGVVILCPYVARTVVHGPKGCPLLKTVHTETDLL